MSALLTGSPPYDALISIRDGGQEVLRLTRQGLVEEGPGYRADGRIWTSHETLARVLSEAARLLRQEWEQHRENDPQVSPS